MDFKHRLNRSFKPRFAIIYPFGLFFLLFGSIDDHSLRAGIGYVIIGLLIRLWSNGYAIKNDKLTTSGPYAYVRNPLYLGTFLTALGFAIMLELRLAAELALLVKFLFLGALSFVYYNTIKSEEKMLADKFGKRFKDYCSKVFAMVPRLTPYTAGEQWGFDMQRLVFSKEYKSMVWMTIIIIAFILKHRLIIEHKPMNSNTWGLVLLCALLVLIDFICEINRKKR